jgi:hypothetical protein
MMSGPLGRTTGSVRKSAADGAFTLLEVRAPDRKRRDAGKAGRE